MSMSRSERSQRCDDLAGELAALLNEATDAGCSAEIDNERLGQLFAALVRTYADKVQNREAVRPFGRNAGLAVTDVAIACTAMMDAVNLELFELGGWQTMSGLGRLERNDSVLAERRTGDSTRRKA